jgi:hypothetical protein
VHDDVSSLRLEIDLKAILFVIVVTLHGILHMYGMNPNALSDNNNPPAATRLLMLGSFIHLLPEGEVSIELLLIQHVKIRAGSGRGRGTAPGG